MASAGSFEWPPQGGGSGSSITIGPFSNTPTSEGLALAAGILNLTAADATHSGGLKAVDWVTFNSKQAALTIGNLTDVGTDGIVITGGTGSIIGSGVAIAQHVADATHNGYLVSTDWGAFNAKQAALTIGNLTDAGTDGIVVTGGTGSIIGSGVSLAQHVADSTHNGYLSSTDWSTFNNKQATITTGNLTDAGTDGITVTGGTGAVIGSGTSLSQRVADSTHNGYLSSTDWSTFNGKQASGNYITALTGDVTASGPGSVASTLATVNSNVGSFTNASITVNGKGLITAASTGGQPALVIQSKTANYTALTTDDLILCNTNAFTVTLYAATGSGRQIRIQKIGSDTNAITIARAGSDTINGTSATTANTQYESVTLVDAASGIWYVLDRQYPANAVNYTPTFAGLGTVSGITVTWQRMGGTMYITGKVIAGTVTATIASFTLPAGYTTTSFINSPQVLVGGGTKGTAILGYTWTQLAAPSDTKVQWGLMGPSDAGYNPVAGSSAFGNGETISWFCTVPIAGWN